MGKGIKQNRKRLEQTLQKGYGKAQGEPGASALGGGGGAPKQGPGGARAEARPWGTGRMPEAPWEGHSDPSGA